MYPPPPFPREVRGHIYKENIPTKNLAIFYFLSIFIYGFFFTMHGEDNLHDAVPQCGAFLC